MNTNTQQIKQQAATEAREEKILARIRHRQLQLAIDGRHEESAHYAQWAHRVRRFLCKIGMCECAAA